MAPGLAEIFPANFDGWEKFQDAEGTRFTKNGIICSYCVSKKIPVFTRSVRVKLAKDGKIEWVSLQCGHLTTMIHVGGRLVMKPPHEKQFETR